MGTGSTLAAATAIGLFEDQVLSRALDVAARELKKTNRSFYTIGSAGHEMNVVLGAQLRLTDPAFLHYRSGALMMARARQLAGSTPAFDTLLGIVASSEDPISAGRHKVWGSRALWVPPQTSTIASHLPKATGTAFSLARARRMGVGQQLPADAIVLASFGDASANHATALAGINTARYAARLGLPCPILFVCEDNGIGISVPTPSGWIAESFEERSPISATCSPTGESTRSGPAWRRPSATSDARGSRRSSTCRRSASGGMPAPTRAHVYRTPAEIAGIGRATRSCAPRGASWSSAPARPEDLGAT